MTDKQAKALGERALALGMPWARGLWDGHDGYHILRVDGRLTNSVYLSWPDFRDPVTEAWLVAWCIEAARAISHVPLHWAALDSGLYTVERQSIWGDWTPLAIAETRAEAWILALETLQEPA